jgi:hypothetical protein
MPAWGWGPRGTVVVGIVGDGVEEMVLTIGAVPVELGKVVIVSAVVVGAVEFVVLEPVVVVAVGAVLTGTPLVTVAVYAAAERVAVVPQPLEEADHVAVSAVAYQTPLTSARWLTVRLRANARR